MPQYPGMSTPYNQPMQREKSQQDPISNSQIMQLIKSKFEEVNKRLEKLDTVERKVQEVDNKLNKLWADLDQRVAQNKDSITKVEDKLETTDFGLAKT